jgi:GntR family transcriptional regulator
MGVDLGSPTPVFIQLADIIRGRIAAGEWSHGPLPSNRAFRQEYGVGEFVVTHALKVLEDEGLVFTVPRRGVYVRQQEGRSWDSPDRRFRRSHSWSQRSHSCRRPCPCRYLCHLGKPESALVTLIVLFGVSTAMYRRLSVEQRIVLTRVRS